MPDSSSLQERQEAFRVAIQNLSLLPLTTAEELNRLGVDYGLESLDELEQAIYGSLETDKILFTGHTGCGKSTLLSELRFRLSFDYFVVLFSIADQSEMADLDHVTILFHVATQLMETAEIKGVAIPGGTKKAFYRWFAEQTQIEADQVEAALETGYELGGGTSNPFVKFWASVKGILKANAVVRNEIRTKFERTISDLIDRINEIAIVIQNAIGKPIVVIIDDLDKLNPDLTDKIYRNNLQPLFQPQFRVVYTFPIFVLRDLPLKKLLLAKTDKFYIMPVAKFFSKGATRQPNPLPNESSVEVFRTILNRRLLPALDLIEPEVAKTLILKSGGDLRELIRLAKHCCDKCALQIRRQVRQADSKQQTSIKINSTILEQVLTDAQITFAESLGQSDYELLKTVYEQFQPPQVDDQRFLDLLHGLYILEYRNSGQWYDLHPIVLDLLKHEGMIGEPS